jgi:N-acyl-D-aspartate/D-glutamate deacylase
MTRLLARCLEEGAVGLSTGLEYATEYGATEEEVSTLCRVVAAVDGLYATHTRNRDAQAVEAIAEAIRTAERSGVRLQISHIIPRSGRAATERCIELVDRALERGVDLAFDMHTRLFGTTYLKALLPPWAFEGGTAAPAARLGDPAAMTAMEQYRSLIVSLGDWDRIVLLDNTAFPEISRLSFAEISKRWHRPPFDCALDILLAEIEQIHRPMVSLHCYSEDQLRLAFCQPACMIGSDATALAPDGPLADAVFHGAYSWASWFFRRMVRETGTLGLAAAIHRLTGLPAERLRLSDRGVLRPGAWADLCLFRADDYGDTATTFDPNRLARGVAHVIVNGTQTLRDGRLTGLRAGAVLRRP